MRDLRSSLRASLESILGPSANSRASYAARLDGGLSPSTLHFYCEILDSALKLAKISYRKMERAGLGVTHFMTGVRVRENESIESAIRRFKKLCEKAGILAELRKREHYEKPSVKRKKKAIAAKKRAMRRVRHSF